MRRAENVNAPSLGGWVLAATAGIVAFAALIVVGDFDLTPAAAIAAVLTVVVGLIVGMPLSAAPAQSAMPAAGSQPAAPPAAAAPATAGPATAGPASAGSANAGSATAGSANAGPARLAAPRGGKADNLKEIEGVGPAMEKLVNEMGFFHFDQIAGWSEADVAWVDANLKGFKGRVTRDRWVAQARIIVNEGLAAFRERAKTNNY